MKNEFLEIFDKYINVFNHYLPDKINQYSNLFDEIKNKINKEDGERLIDIDKSILEMIESGLFNCLKILSFRINDKIFKDNLNLEVEPESYIDSYMDDQMIVFDFMLQFQNISKHQINYKNTLKKINNLWSDIILFRNDDAHDFKFNEKALNKFFQRQNIFFNSLDKLNQSLFNIRFLYFHVISRLDINNKTNIDSNNVVDSIVNSLFNLLKDIPYTDINNSLFSESDDLINILRKLYELNSKNEEIFLELFKYIDLDSDLFNVNDIKIFGNEILKENIDFFDEIFKLSPQMNNFRLKLSILSIELNSVNMLDYFLDKEYLSSINEIKMMDDIETEIEHTKNSWVNSKINENILLHDNILLKIKDSDKKELFIKKILMRNEKTLNPIPIYNLLEELKRKPFNFNTYFTLVKPLLTKEILEESTQKLGQFIENINNINIDENIVNSLNESLKFQLGQFNKTRKIQSIKLKI